MVKKEIKMSIVILSFFVVFIVMIGAASAAENNTGNDEIVSLNEVSTDKLSSDYDDWDDDYEDDDLDDWDDGYEVKKPKKTKLTIKAPKVTKKYKKSAKFKIKVKYKSNKKAAKKIKLKVKVKTKGKYRTYKLKTNKKGVAYLNTKKLKVGTHKVIITPLSSKFTGKIKSSIKIKKPVVKKHKKSKKSKKSSRGGYYVASANSDKFHYSSCSAAKRIKSYNKVTFSSRSDAISAGYSSCRICHA